MWNGFENENFIFEGRDVQIIFPKKAEKKRRWALKTEYWDAFPETEILLLNEGYHILFVRNKSRFAPEPDTIAKKHFLDYAIKKYKLSKKGTLVGYSQGGHCAINFTAKYPQYVNCIYFDAPVYDMCSLYCDESRKGTWDYVWDTEVLVAFPFLTRSILDEFSFNPKNNFNALIENKIPMILSYGTEDSVVPFEKNGKIIAKKYKENGLKYKVLKREGQEHHPHGFGLTGDKAKELIDFIKSCE